MVVLLTLLFGWAGYYRFHKKQYGLGVLYLFTGGLFMIGWLVDLSAAIKEMQEEGQNSTQSVNSSTNSSVSSTSGASNSSSQKSFSNLAVEAREEVEANANRSIFDPFKTKDSEFFITDSAIILNGKAYPYANCGKIHVISGYKLAFNAEAAFEFGNQTYKLFYTQKDCNRGPKAFEYANKKIAQAHGEELPLYSLISHLGTELLVYNDYIALTHVKTTTDVLDYIGKRLSGGNSGAKKIDIEDIISIQHREPSGLSAGFIQFSFPGSIEYRGGATSALNDENAILYDTPRLEDARTIVSFLEKRKKELKKAATAPVQQISSAEELKKYKELLDCGVITQEEFDAKKKQLLGL